MALAVAVLVPCTAAAVPIAVEGRRLVVVDRGAATDKTLIRYIARDYRVQKDKFGSPGTGLGQISATIAVSYPGSSLGGFYIPAGPTDGRAGWTHNDEKQARYRNRDAPNGPTSVKQSVLREGRVLTWTANRRGDLLPLDIVAAGPPTSSIYTSYCSRNGSDHFCHCTEFEPRNCSYRPIAGGAGARLVCKNGKGDESCRAICSSHAAPANINVPVGSGHYVTCDYQSVFDTRTSNQLERKTGDDGVPNPADLHDVDNRYVWSGWCSTSGKMCQPNPAAAETCDREGGFGSRGCELCGPGEGTCLIDERWGAITTIWEWINQVNAAGYLGHHDWSPAGTYELQGLVHPDHGACGGGLPDEACVAPIVGPTRADFYTTGNSNWNDEDESSAFVVPFQLLPGIPPGARGWQAKTDGRTFVRASRYPF